MKVEKYLIEWRNTVTGETGDNGVYIDRLDHANRLANAMALQNKHIVYTVTPVMVEEENGKNYKDRR